MGTPSPARWLLSSIGGVLLFGILREALTPGTRFSTGFVDGLTLHRLLPGFAAGLPAYLLWANGPRVLLWSIALAIAFTLADVLWIPFGFALQYAPRLLTQIERAGFVGGILGAAQWVLLRRWWAARSWLTWWAPVSSVLLAGGMALREFVAPAVPIDDFPVMWWPTSMVPWFALSVGQALYVAASLHFFMGGRGPTRR